MSVDKKGFDIRSFQLGMNYCFIEMVACGLKKMAISPPLTPEEYENVKDDTERIAKAFGVRTFLTHSLIITDIQSAEFTKGKWSILFYDRDEFINKYKELEERIDLLEREGKYEGEEKKEITREFGRLLSYPEERIELKLSKTEPPTPFDIDSLK